MFALSESMSLTRVILLDSASLSFSMKLCVNRMFRTSNPTGTDIHTTSALIVPHAE